MFMGVAAVLVGAVAGVVGPSVKRRQQNFRLPDELIGRLERVVPAVGEARRPEHRAADKSDAVRLALEAWLADVPSSPLPESFEGQVLRVVAPAELGTLVQVEELGGGVGRGAALRVARTGELLEVRDVEPYNGGGGVLAVSRGGGCPPAAIHAGDELQVLSDVDALPVGKARLEGADVRADAEPGRAAAADAADNGVAPAVEVVETVDLAAWLAEKLGKPAAITRAYIADSRVTVKHESARLIASRLEDARGDDECRVPVEDLGQVRLDGELVAS